MPSKNSSVYLFLGEEDFLKEQEIEKLKSKFLEKSTKDLNYCVFYGKDRNFNAKEMLDALNTLPFMSKKRMVVLKDADSLSAADKESILFYLRNPRESSVFVIESTSAVIKSGFLLEVSQHAHLTNYRRLTDEGVNAWINRKASLSGKKISAEAISLIKENLPNDLRMVSSNMGNIILYIGRKPVITKEDVENVVGVSPLHTAFDLIDTMARKDVKKALRIFDALKKDRKKETELIGFLAWNMRMLLRVKGLLNIKNKAEICKEIGLYPSKLAQLVQQANLFKKNEILALLKELLKADVDIKTGMPPAAVMERLIIRMCS